MFKKVKAWLLTKRETAYERAYEFGFTSAAGAVLYAYEHLGPQECNRRIALMQNRVSQMKRRDAFALGMDAGIRYACRLLTTGERQ